MQEASSEYLDVQVVKQLVSRSSGSKRWVSGGVGRGAGGSSVYLLVSEADLEVYEASGGYLEVLDAVGVWR